MGRLSEFRVRMTDRANALTGIVSVLAETPTIALVRGAMLAMEQDAANFEVFPTYRHFAPRHR